MAILMRQILLIVLAAAISRPLGATDAGSFVALCYHEVTGDTPEAYSSTAISVRDLAAQFAWLQANGYHPVSIEAIVASRNGGPALPEHAILLTFDDGLASVHQRVFPLLKLFKYPAVVAPVGSWMDLAPNESVSYGEGQVSGAAFVSWSQLREMQQSGLVEVASHSYRLHLGLVGNPMGNVEPAAITRVYADGRYETDDAYVGRLRADLGRAREQMLGHMQVAPRVMVWPYGRSNRTSQQVAASLGMPVGLTLEDGVNTPQTPLATLRRHLVQNPMALTALAEILRQTWPSDPRRSVRIDPGDWPVAGEARLSVTLEQLVALKPNLVFISPRQGDAAHQATLFPTARLPMRADLLNRIGWQIESRAGAAVYVDLPADWLGDMDLVGDLARQVNLSGLSVPLVPGSMAAEQLRHAAERWRWPIHLVYVMQGLPDPGLWSRLPDDDWIRLPARDDVLAGLPDAARGHVMLQFDATRLTPATARQMRALKARGFGDFAIDGLPTAVPDEVRREFSLRDEPRP
nr:poly-beta-1,6-N-acetyl-D-glucosamine N-deacetylase PgaB [Dyella soli]